MRDILPFRPAYQPSAVVEYPAEIARPGRYVIRCERIDQETAERCNLPATWVRDVNQWWLVSLVSPSGEVVCYLPAHSEGSQASVPSAE
jgi:hypothetical protein